MAVQFGVYEGLLVLGVVVTSLVATYTWRRRHRPGAVVITVTLLADAGWIGTALLGSVTRFTDLALASAYLTYLFAPVAAAGLFVFALVYTGREEWLTPRTYALVAIEPILVNLAAWTNPLHGQFLSAAQPAGTTARIGWEITFGPLFLIHTAYSYALMAAATVLIVRFVLGSDRLYQRQVLVIIASLAAPWVSNVLFVANVVAIDPTPVAFTLTSVGVAWVVLRGRVLDITPIARDAVVDSINDAVIVVDGTETIVDSNPAAAWLFDVDDGSTPVGRRLSSVLPDDSALQSRCLSLLSTEAEQSVECQHRDRHLSVEASPLTDIRNERIGTVLVVHDVTERKQREVTLQRRNEQLDRFAGVVSHDLRNPLNVASGSLQLARESGDPTHFDRAERAHDRMERLIEGLLTLATEGKGVTERRPVSLAETAHAAWGTVATDDATLTVDGDATVTADPNRLQQLLENLYRNSVEHGGETVTVCVAVTDDGFLVEDDGPGIPPSVREDVLQPGYTTEADGSGIGLMIVTHVADAHDWSLAIGEGSQGGARFRFDGVATAE
jgi:PAS domain S-box-containing protein